MGFFNFSSQNLISIIDKFNNAWGPINTYLKTNMTDLSWLTVIAILLTIVFILLISYHFRFENKKDSSNHLGFRPISNLRQLKDVVVEIHYAACHCGHGNSKMVNRCKELLEKYPIAANIPMKNHNYTPFLRACWNGCLELIEFMINIGADVTRTTDAGEGPIYLVTYHLIKTKSQDFSALMVLLAAGADIQQSRRDGVRAVDLAFARGHTRLARWLLAQTPTLDMPTRSTSLDQNITTYSSSSEYNSFSERG